MKIKFLDKTMTKVNKYLPFTLLFISTIILTVLAFILLPLILAYKKLDSLLRKGAMTGLRVFEDKQIYNEHNNAYTYYIRGPEE
jgi:hypothetical protein